MLSELGELEPEGLTPSASLSRFIRNLTGFSLVTDNVFFLSTLSSLNLVEEEAFLGSLITEAVFFLITLCLALAGRLLLMPLGFLMLPCFLMEDAGLVTDF